MTTNRHLIAALTVLGMAAPAAAAQQPGAPGYGPWVFLFCQYSDIPPLDSATVRLQRFLEGTDGLWSFLDAISHGQFVHQGSIAIDSVLLPASEAEYHDRGIATVRPDCIASADPAVFYPSFYGIVFQVNGQVGGVRAHGGRLEYALDGTPARPYGAPKFSVDAFPSAGASALERRARVRLYAHEMGHGLGLLHANVRRPEGSQFPQYSSPWDLMGTGHRQLGAAFMAWLGWLPASRITRLPAGTAQRRSLELVRLASPPAQGLLMIEAPLGAGSPHYYTVEARRRSGVDTQLENEAVLVHLVDTTRFTEGQPETWLQPAIRNGQFPRIGDEGHRPGEAFGDSVYGFYVDVDSTTATGYAVTVTRGWTVTVSVDGPGAVVGLTSTARCDAVCEDLAAERGRVVRLTAEPDPGYVFAGWDGDCSGGAVECTMTLGDRRRTIATFAAPLVAPAQSLLPGTAARWYEQRLADPAGLSDVRWTLDAATPLPRGLALVDTSGVVRGWPATVGRFPLNLTVHWKALSADVSDTLVIRRAEISVDVLLDALLHLSQPLPGREAEALDASGNDNGAFDLGDFRAWLQADADPDS